MEDLLCRSAVSTAPATHLRSSCSATAPSQASQAANPSLLTSRVRTTRFTIWSSTMSTRGLIFLMLLSTCAGESSKRHIRNRGAEGEEEAVLMKERAASFLWSS